MDILEFRQIVTDVSERAILTIRDRLDEGGLDENSLYKMSNAICSLSRAVSEAERGARTKAAMLDRVRGEFRALVKRSLAADPELCQQLYDVGDRALLLIGDSGLAESEEQSQDE